MCMYVAGTLTGENNKCRVYAVTSVKILLSRFRYVQSSLDSLSNHLPSILSFLLFLYN